MARRTVFSLTVEELNIVFNACAAASLLAEIMGSDTRLLDRVNARLSDALAEATGVEIVIQEVADGHPLAVTENRGGVLRSVPEDGDE